MKTVTVNDFLQFGPCYTEERIREIAGDKTEWTALDVLALEGLPPRDKLQAVLRENFLSASELHEFMCRCAERALALVKNPDPRSIAGPEAKRAWLRGEIDDAQLDAARTAAWDALGALADAAWGAERAAWAAWAAALAAAWSAAEAAAGAAWAAWAAARVAAQAAQAARAVARKAAWSVERAAESAAWAAADEAAQAAAWEAVGEAAQAVQAATRAARTAEQAAQVELLVELLREAEDEDRKSAKRPNTDTDK